MVLPEEKTNDPQTCRLCQKGTEVMKNLDTTHHDFETYDIEKDIEYMTVMSNNDPFYCAI